MDKVREEFEDWYSHSHEGYDKLKRYADGNYKLISTSTAWHVWQAATEAADRRVEKLREALGIAKNRIETCYNWINAGLGENSRLCDSNGKYPREDTVLPLIEQALQETGGQS